MGGEIRSFDVWRYQGDAERLARDVVTHIADPSSLVAVVDYLNVEKNRLAKVFFGPTGIEKAKNKFQSVPLICMPMGEYRENDWTVHYIKGQSNVSDLLMTYNHLEVRSLRGFATVDIVRFFLYEVMQC